MIIDGHAHACGDYLTPESIIKNLNDNNVDLVILSPGELNSKKTYTMPNIAELFPTKNVAKVTNVMTKMVTRLTRTIDTIPLGNEYVYDLTTKCQNRVLQSIWVTSKIPNTESYLSQKLNDWHFKSLKIHQCWENISIDSGFFQTVAQWSEINNIPFFIHPSTDSEVLKIIEYKKKHINLKLIVAHLFGLELFIKDGHKDENLYFDISSLQYTSTLRVLKAIDYLGIDKILLGSDTPYGENNLKKNIDRIYSLNLLDSEKQMILGDNMKKLLKI
jgi:predicted TIM-barrel fold metal-dependent hydrolase